VNLSTYALCVTNRPIWSRQNRVGWPQKEQKISHAPKCLPWRIHSSPAVEDSVAPWP